MVKLSVLTGMGQAYQFNTVVRTLFIRVVFVINGRRTRLGSKRARENTGAGGRGHFLGQNRQKRDGKNRADG